MKKNEGGPAFPGFVGSDGNGPYILVPGTDGKAWIEVTPGMTLRQYYKGQALAGLLASPNPGVWGTSAPTVYSERAAQYADAMIAEDEKP